MKNYLEYLLKSKLTLNIKGNNIERFIKRIKNNNIEILNIKYISKSEITIKIYKYDYDKIISIKTIYEIEILDCFGIEKMKNNLLNKKYIIIFILIALIFLYVITNLIFTIDIITNDSNMKNKLQIKLEELGIKRYNFKKNYIELQKIKKEILSEYKNEIEWIEIENIGTKYIIRYEPRILNYEEEDIKLRNIVAKKDAVITHMNISSGQIIKDINTYVKKGDVIVSGYITLNDSVKDTVSSNGTIYGEVWYNVNITYPYKYYQKYSTGRNKDVIVIKFLNKKIELFNFNKYETKDTIDKVIFKNNLLPISIVIQKQKETKIIDENNNSEQAIAKAIEYSMKKIEVKLNDGEYINNYKILNKTENPDSITLNIFFSVIENITEYQDIDEYKEDTDSVN